MDNNTKKIMFSTGKDEWETPWFFYKKLNSIFKFTLDPCSTHDNHKCEKYYTVEDDGLSKDWKLETAFVNPPYSKNKLWIEKCYNEGKKYGTSVAALIPSRTDTKYWHDYCLKADYIYFVKGRIQFCIDGMPILDKNGRPQSAPFPSAVVVWDGSLPSSLKKDYPSIKVI